MTSLVNRNIDSAKVFHEESVKKILLDIISARKGYKKVKGQKNESKLTIEQLTFINLKIDIIINGKPDEFINLHENFSKISPSNFNQTKDLFNSIYENHFKNNYFLEKLGIDTCIYCNRNYTIQIVRDRARSELDHWFPKAVFPILALNFYNLIPSCHSCNHIKGDGNDVVKIILKNNNASNEEIKKWWTEKALIDINHPYLKSNDFKFTWFYGESFDKTNVEFRIKNKETDNTLEFNRTKEIYNAHSKKELKDLINLRYKYSDNYIDILINKTFKGILSKEEIYRMIFGIEIKEENYHLRPFSKFKHDIIEELKKI